MKLLSFECHTVIENENFKLSIHEIYHALSGYNKLKYVGFINVILPLYTRDQLVQQYNSLKAELNGLPKRRLVWAKYTKAPPPVYLIECAMMMAWGSIQYEAYRLIDVSLRTGVHFINMD